MDWERIEKGARIRFRLDGREAEGEVIDINGRRASAEGTDPGSVDVRLDSGKEVTVSARDVIEVVQAP